MIMGNLSLIDILEKHQSTFKPVVPFDADKQRLLPLDLSAKNPALHQIDEFNLGMFVQQQLDAAHAVFGIGGYLEDRRLYRHSSLFGSDTVNEAPEPRTIHLGVDIWGVGGSHVHAPLAGNVHSFAFNNQEGDYGATIILQHQLEGIVFYTLYGHLSLADIAHLENGRPVVAGQHFAHFGSPAENGNWPPHLHFQIISDMQGKTGDYPGVCAVSQVPFYRENCPDGNLILQLR